jgi:putative flavoprotein involved in K+ transport
MPREWLGIPLMYTALPIDQLPDRVGDVSARVLQRMIYGDLTAYGLPQSPYGIQTDARRRHTSTLIDAGFVNALKSGALELVAAVEAFDGSDVVLADNSRIRPEVIICATCYTGGLMELVGRLGHPPAAIQRASAIPLTPRANGSGIR